MGELFISVAELKRVKKQCQPRKEIYIYIYIYKTKLERKGVKKKGEGDMTWWGKIERLGQLMAQKIVIIEHLNPTSILWKVQKITFFIYLVD